MLFETYNYLHKINENETNLKFIKSKAFLSLYFIHFIYTHYESLKSTVKNYI